ncbi:hypothetical protein AFLA_004898 [Aspergillus flavus NRRL3357]|nr:hypothetical protein AFLA_004898 [Aspergillus flavus NRRL3357]
MGYHQLPVFSLQMSSRGTRIVMATHSSSALKPLRLMLIEVSHWSKEWRGSAQGQRVCVAELPQITPHRGL